MNKFALLVPCYNASKFVDTFLSNISQLKMNFDEVIFFDDGSDDNTVDLLENRGYQVIKGHQNRGPSYARNELVKHTKCNWIHFHDIDDLLKPNYLEETSNIANLGLYEIILCNVDWYSEDGSKVLIRWSYSDENIKKDPIGYTISNPIGGINGLYKRDTFLKVGGFDEHICYWEDADLHVRLALANSKFYIIEKVLSISIRHSNTHSKDQKSSWLSRFILLKSYQTICLDNKQATFRIGIEFQKAANGLIYYHDYNRAEQALYFSEDCGVQVPQSRKLVWQLLKKTLPKNIRIKIRLIHLKRLIHS